MIKRMIRQQYVCIIAVPLLLFSVPGTADSTAIHPDADKILQSMSSYLDSLSSFSMKANIENEIVSDEGQKLHLSSFAGVAIERPGKMHITRKGTFADVEMVYDGKTFTLHSKGPNTYIQRDAPGTVDDAIRLLEFETGLDAPGADLLFTNSYSILKSGITRGEYFGTTIVDGVECHHLAFRENKVDWQLWVKAGSEPLPMKYVITSKWITAAPQYTVRIHDWNTKAQTSASQFTFSAPKGAKRIDGISFNEMGEVKTEEGGQQ